MTKKKLEIKAIGNKRKLKRYSMSYPTEIISNNITFKGFTSDFSLNGLFLVSNHPFAPGMKIDILIYLHDGSISRIKGRVVRFKRTPRDKIKERHLIPGKNGMGIEIIERDANYLHLIRSLLR